MYIYVVLYGSHMLSSCLQFYASGYSGQGIDNEKLAVNLMDRFKGMAPDKFVTTRVGGPEPGQWGQAGSPVSTVLER